MNGFPNQSNYCLQGKLLCYLIFDGVQQLDIVKFALPLVKISFHPIFSVVGKHTNFFEASRAASQPYFDGVQRLATSTYKPARLGKSLLLGLSRRSGQTYPLVADRVASRPCFDGVRRVATSHLSRPD